MELTHIAYSIFKQKFELTTDSICIFDKMQNIRDAYAAYYDDTAHVLVRDDANPIWRAGAWTMVSMYRWYNPEEYEKWVTSTKEAKIAEEVERRMKIINGENGQPAAEIEKAVQKRLVEKTAI